MRLDRSVQVSVHKTLEIKDEMRWVEGLPYVGHEMRSKNSERSSDGRRNVGSLFSTCVLRCPFSS